MQRLGSVQELAALRARLVQEQDPQKPVIVITAGTCGQTSGANELIRAAQRQILAQGLATRVGIRVTGCHGFCQMEPSAVVEPRGTFYAKIPPERMAEIVDATARGEVVRDLLVKNPETGRALETQEEIGFYAGQRRNLLNRIQRIDPLRINDYIAAGGYGDIARVLERADPDWALREVKASGLRGRGGAGFPTGAKWEMLAAQRGSRPKVLVCNADEGDPGAYMDRSMLEGNPHGIIEGMLIGAYATGAAEGVVYVRSEYPLAVRNLQTALRQAREMGLLGDDILGTGFNFDISIVKGAGAFVCGEETALMRSIEGYAGEPRQRPPYPIQKGVHGKPTVINNVETWANIPLIFSMSAERFAEVGTPGNSGTKIFSLVGKIRNTGLVEVPMGMTIREIVYDIGGGPVGSAAIKAVQTGGPSGGCIPASLFDLRIDYDSLAQAGSIMGSGGMIVMDDTTCMVDVAKYFMRFLMDESCGKCLTCRKGTQRMYEILDDISRGRGKMQDLDLLEELAMVVKDTTMCGLGQTAPNPVLSTLRYFREEYERHIVDRRCDAFVCRDLVGAPCQSACPVGTEAWRYIAHIRRGEYEEAYKVIREPNPLPSVCARVCHHPCEDRCRSGASGGEPVAVRALKRFVTDKFDPAKYNPARRAAAPDGPPRKVAVVGSGPAGLAAAHSLSMLGHKVTIFEAAPKPGGMLVTGIPEYRLPRDVINKEIQALLDENVTLACGQKLGRDFTIDSLFASGFDAVFLAIGAHKDRRLGIEGEDAAGVYPSMEFLGRFNLHGEQLARGRVGVVGGGNAAVDAARVAMRQEGVSSVTIVYRRTRHEMPAFEEEIDAAIEEGVTLATLVSPVRVHADHESKSAPLEEEIDAAVEEGVAIEALTSPVKIHSEGGRLTGLECVSNRLGEVDGAGRRRPIPIPGSEHVIPLDTLIVAIGEQPDVDCIACDGIRITSSGAIEVDRETRATGRPGVFAGGDVASGPGTVIDAIADGKRAAAMIDLYLRGEQMKVEHTPRIPSVYVEPPPEDGLGLGSQTAAQAKRVSAPMLPVEERARCFAEVELPLSPEDAVREAGRCLRCDLEFIVDRGAGNAPDNKAETAEQEAEGRRENRSEE